MDIINLDTETTRVYPRDWIPLHQIFGSYFLDLVQEHFQFEDAEVVADESESESRVAVFRGRAMDESDGRFSGILELRIEECRVRVKCADVAKGHSVIDEFLKEFGSRVAEHLGRPNDWVAKFEHEATETSWVGKLNIDPLSLVDPRVRKALQSVEKLSKSSQRDAYLSLDDLSFRIVYHISDRDLLESQIYFVDKEFRLEPRMGVSPKARQWYSVSPLRSDQHLQILKTLEADFAKK